MRTGGQGRKCAFPNFPTRSLRTDQWTNGQTDGWKKPLIVACLQLKRMWYYVSSSTVILGYHYLSTFLFLLHDVLSLKYKFHDLSLIKPFVEFPLFITTPRWLWWKNWNFVTLGPKSGHFALEIWPKIYEIMKLELKS